MKLVKLVVRCAARGRREIGCCPRCGGALVARLLRSRPVAWCRCPVKRGLAMGA